MCRRIIVISISFLVIIHFSLLSFDKGNAAQHNALPSGYAMVAETQALSLYYNKDSVSIAVRDNRSGFTWSSSFYDESVTGELNQLWQDNVRSLFNLTYTNIADDAVRYVETGSIRLDPEVSHVPINNGLRITFRIAKLRLSIDLEFSIEQDRLHVRIPSGGIIEHMDVDEEKEIIIDRLQNDIDLIQAKLQDFEGIRLSALARREYNNVSTIVNNLEMVLNDIDSIAGLRTQANTGYAQLTYFEMVSRGTPRYVGLLQHLEQMAGQRGVEQAIDTLNEIISIGGRIRDNVSKLRDFESAAVVKIELLPFFGAASDNESGYVFYPDGSGALTYFERNDRKWNEFFQKDIYADDEINLDTFDIQRRKGLKDVRLPVFGIRKGNDAFVAIISEGDSDAAVSFYPSGFQLRAYRASFSFIYRREFRVGVRNAENQLPVRIARHKLSIDREVQYHFLPQNQADYSGMAGRYRDFLLEHGKISDRVDGEKTPLALDIFMGIKEERILFDRFISMTTFEQTKQIIEQLSDEGIYDLQLNLVGWMQGGYGNVPQSFNPARQLGGRRGLSELSEFSRERGIPLYLTQNLVNADRRNGGFSVHTDVARERGGTQLTNRTLDKYLLSPRHIWEMFADRITPNVFRNIRGFAFEKIGSFIYSDYNSAHPSSRESTMSIWDDIIGMSEDNFGGAAVYGGNAYAFKHVERIMEIAVGSTGYGFTDRSIPFFQMVVHGLIAYSGGHFNLFYDEVKQKLKAIEYGVMPSFRLTWSESRKMVHTGHNELFSSEFDKWKSDVVRVYNEFNTRLIGLHSQIMLHHEQINDYVVRIRYEKGATVYVNYSERAMRVRHVDPTDSDNNRSIVIPGLDFLVVDEEGNIR